MDVWASAAGRLASALLAFLFNRSILGGLESEVLAAELFCDSCSSLFGQTQVWLDRTQDVQRGFVSSHFLRLLRQVRHPFLERGWFRRYFVG
jgi:hypothetical protein